MSPYEHIMEELKEKEHYNQIDCINKTLNKRGDRYGQFFDNAQVSQDLKDILRNSRNWTQCKLTLEQKEALDFICGKIARVVNGDPKYKDNWVDIEGYARLVSDTL